jgi:hypothetical protein
MKPPVIIKIVDVKGPIDLLTFTDILLICAEIILLISIISWAVSFARKKFKEISRATPYESACKELSVVKSAAAKKTISPQECCSRISLMLRRYVKDAFRTGSPELTTAEFLEEFNTIAASSDDIKHAAVDLLSLCDLVKFSGYDPSREDIEAAINTADKIVAALSTRETGFKGTQ